MHFFLFCKINIKIKSYQTILITSIQGKIKKDTFFRFFLIKLNYLIQGVMIVFNLQNLP